MRTNDTEALFRNAVDSHIHGRLAEAVMLYGDVIRANPGIAAAHCNLAIVLQSLDRPDDALRSYERAIRIQPNNANTHYNRGIALTQLGRFEEAVHSYDEAIRLKPDHLLAQNNKGVALRSLNRSSEAIACFDRAIELQPDHPEAHYNRAGALQNLRRLEEALQSLDKAIELKPHYAEAFSSKSVALRDLKRADDALSCANTAIILNPRLAEAYWTRANALQDLGKLDRALEDYDRAVALNPAFAEAHNGKANALKDLGRLLEAVHAFDRAIAVRPDYADAHNNKGNVLQTLRRPYEAIESYERAIELRPDDAQAHSNRGNVLRSLGRLDEALQSLEKAISLKPDLAEAYNNRGNVLKEQRRLRESLQSFDRAIALRENFADAHLNKGICALLMGNFDEGWPLYERRKESSEPAGNFNSPKPAWSGVENLTGKFLYVHAEQGLGDAIQFCRYARLAQEKGASVILAVQKRMVRLVESLNPEITIEAMDGQPTAFDFHIALLSMPAALRTTLSTCPASVPYLHAEPERVEIWERRIGSNGFKVGICWQGNKQARLDRGRSFPLRLFEPLGRLPNVRLISLQKNEGIEQLSDLPPGMKVETLGEEFDAGPDAFIDTAAVMECLDLVVTSDTAIAHLAGALGRPVWVALRYMPDWRWLLDRADSPWYPTMRLFRQPEPGDWSSVFADMETQLTVRLGR